MHKHTLLRSLKAAIFTTAVTLTATSCQPSKADPTGRILEVDSKGSTPYKTIASAVKEVKPGDTIRLKPNTGPYREILEIRTSGTEKNPITFDGGNNVVTAFDPISDWEEKDGAVSTHLKTFPYVLAYKGERLVQDPVTNQFTKYADFDPATNTITLRAGVEKTGWEVSARALAVGVSNASHQIYRNVKASGSTNDGFNLHGTGTDLLFENIEAFYNLDEGFSTHDGIQSIIKGGKFWRNDNGIANSYENKDVVSSTIIDTDCWDNLGFGLSLHDCAAKMQNVRIWNNGLRQLRFNNANIDCDKVTVYTPKFKKRQLVSYTDSKDTVIMIAYSAGQTTVTGTTPTVETIDAPPN